VLSTPLNLGAVEAGVIYDFLYTFFHRDFVDQRTLLNGVIHITPRSGRLEDGKERDFWHLTTRDTVYTVRVGKNYVTRKERVMDYRRAERIEWVRQIIVNHSNSSVKLFYHKESNQDRDIRLYLWAYESDFVVILQKLGGNSSFLVTSFYITHDGKRKDYEKRHRSYVNQEKEELKGCEWF
jgi:hypothetical protein